MIKEGPDMKKWRKRGKQKRKQKQDPEERNLKPLLHPGEADQPKSKGPGLELRASACSRDCSRNQKVRMRGVKNLPMFRQRGVKTKMKSSVILVASDHL